MTGSPRAEVSRELRVESYELRVEDRGHFNQPGRDDEL